MEANVVKAELFEVKSELLELDQQCFAKYLR